MYLIGQQNYVSDSRTVSGNFSLAMTRSTWTWCPFSEGFFCIQAIHVDQGVLWAGLRVAMWITHVRWQKFRPWRIARKVTRLMSDSKIHYNSLTLQICRKIWILLSKLLCAFFSLSKDFCGPFCEERSPFFWGGGVWGGKAGPICHFAFSLVLIVLGGPKIPRCWDLKHAHDHVSVVTPLFCAKPQMLAKTRISRAVNPIC